jgi:hypothetical protein
MLELRLIHDGEFWIAENVELRVTGATLPALDRELARVLGRGRHRGEAEIEVRMTFDNSVIPQWIRQYSNHYFNRVVSLNLNERSIGEEEVP